ncbi:hypothetical protein CEXT_789521 [Caerostris extrusa]|uniref:Uncharacterized protein n=1 Tax=Caerostris extrusa TaxID=172846 RepID=A0AAV4M5L2_CAEEX|nr:hypothetical protein CEXT_789521 [Caerostris extrusa]
MPIPVWSNATSALGCAEAPLPKRVPSINQNRVRPPLLAPPRDGVQRGPLHPMVFKINKQARKPYSPALDPRMTCLEFQATLCIILGQASTRSAFVLSMTG